MTRPRSEIIARIKACMKLANPTTNSNEHERIAARKAADALVIKHGITAEELHKISSELPESIGIAENLSSVLAALKKSGVSFKRGWVKPETPPIKPRKETDVP